MARTLRKIAFVVEEFAVPSPAQQLIDRFLIGYPRDGGFHRLEGCKVSVHLTQGGENAELERRTRDFGLAQEIEMERAIAGADAVVVVWRGSGAGASGALLKRALELAPRGAACFVHGVLSRTLAGAQAAAEFARFRNVALLAGTAWPVTWRLPQVDLPAGARVKEALIVVQGTLLDAELSGLEGLLPVMERRRGGEAGIRSVRFLEGQALWRAGDKGDWSWPLLAAALSRSDSPQGDPVADGRTQDLVGLGLVSKLANKPRGWLLEHHDGVRSAVLVLNGVVADHNFAVRVSDGSVVSAQLYRPPDPAQHQFSRLAAAMEDFFTTGREPWPAGRKILTAGLLETFATRETLSGKGSETPGLGVCPCSRR